jgi:hypothetical protein
MPELFKDTTDEPRGSGESSPPTPKPMSAHNDLSKILDKLALDAAWWGFDIGMGSKGRHIPMKVNETGVLEAEAAINYLFTKRLEEVIGEDIKLTGDIDDELLEYVPDMKQGSIEVTGVSSSFTNMYTRAIVNSVLKALRQRAGIDTIKKNVEEK